MILYSYTVKLLCCLYSCSITIEKQITLLVLHGLVHPNTNLLTVFIIIYAARYIIKILGPDVCVRETVVADRDSEAGHYLHQLHGRAAYLPATGPSWLQVGAVLKKGFYEPYQGCLGGGVDYNHPPLNSPEIW